MKKVLILGGGYGGLLSALTVRKYLTPQEASVTVINRFPTHQIITELHRLAAGNLDEKAVGLPLEKLLRGKDIDLIIDSVGSIQPEKKIVVATNGFEYTYDILVVALGSETAFYGIEGIEENSFTLKSVEEANRLRAHIDARLEAYSQSKDKADATIVVAGGGLTGIELVGELVDMLPEWCRQKSVNFSDISLYCAEAGPSILAGFEAELVERAQSSLEKRGVTFLTGVPIAAYKDGAVELKDGRTFPTNTLVWTAGVQGHSVVMNSGIEVNRGRATVTEGLQSTSHSDIFLAGDSAVVMSADGRPYPPTAQLAWQMGETVGYNIFAYIKGLEMEKFEPVNSGKLASLGRKDAIASVGASGTFMKGFPAALLKEGSKTRYLTHINALFAYAY
ncbi:NAD(P)/FAD-dependent oxidoreductase [Brevibacillus dissolubilis]|uniref:NAD(P)/FAD-dependent oxidoreductase n=1 Tax=Brevibacillus dissolubilis TaxID=1844116 RepID=UPI001115F70B|nr:NAD(P)/FAD-dependent oxidoreductase [Brevibacillus dissolubilis]